MIGATRFPPAYQDYPTHRLLDVFEAGTRRLRKVLSGLTDEEALARAIPEKWSIHEIVLHVADSELMGAARFRQALSQSGRAFAFYDQDVWAARLRYQDERDAPSVAAVRRDEAFAMFANLRTTTARLLRAARDEDWLQTGLHAELGEVTLRQLLELYADHSERHVEQIQRRRALLGTPIRLPSLLSDRLY